MSEIAYQPGIDNAPFGNFNANPQSSEYKLVSGYNPTETILLQKVIRRIIIDTSPEQYNALKIVYEKPMEERGSDEHEFLEKTFGRSPISVNGTSAAVPGAPGTAVQQTITVTAASLNVVSNDIIVIYPDGTHGIVKGKPSATTILVESPTGGSLPAVNAGDFLSLQSTIRGDGQTIFQNYERLDTITRFNFIQEFLRAGRWNRKEMQKYINQGTTNYLDLDKKEKVTQIRTDMFNSYFNGLRAEYLLTDGTKAKSMGGIYPTMIAAGSMNATVTLAGFQAAFEKLSFKTNFKKEGGVRMVYGTQEMLYNFSKIFKQPGLRYSPSDTIANLNLNEVNYGGMRFVLVPCELFRELSCFPAEWRNKILVVDQETVQPVSFRGLPSMEMGQTLDMKNNGTREDFIDFWVRTMLGMEFTNPLGSFWMQLS